MDWKNNGIEGFEINEDGRLALLIQDRADLIRFAGFCLEGQIECWDDDGEPVLSCDDPALLVQLARDLLIAATASHFDLVFPLH